MLLYPLPRYLLSLSAKNLSRHLILKNPQPMFLPQLEGTSFLPILLHLGASRRSNISSPSLSPRGLHYGELQFEIRQLEQQTQYTSTLLLLLLLYNSCKYTVNIRRDHNVHSSCLILCPSCTNPRRHVTNWNAFYCLLIKLYNLNV